MRHMVALGIGASLICLLGCEAVMESRALASNQVSDLSTTLASQVPTCFAEEIESNALRIIDCLPNDGSDLTGDILFINYSSRYITDYESAK